MSDQVAVAIITGGFGVLAAMLEFARRQNVKDHGVVSTKLDTLKDGHARLESKLDNHINDHAKGEFQ
jgi:hypothetical protein